MKQWSKTVWGGEGTMSGDVSGPGSDFGDASPGSDGAVTGDGAVKGGGAGRVSEVEGVSRAGEANILARLDGLEALLAGVGEGVDDVSPAGVLDVVERVEVLSRRGAAFGGRLVARPYDRGVVGGGGVWGGGGGRGGGGGQCFGGVGWAGSAFRGGGGGCG